MADQQFPKHITDYTSVVTVLGGWYTHEHAHKHPPDDRSINHTRSVTHKHEHYWDDQRERHHHDPAAPRPDSAADVVPASDGDRLDRP
jgi:hypothetical protein